MSARVVALTRTSSDEDARAAREPFDGLAPVSVVEVGSRQAKALVARLGVQVLPAWLWSVGESTVVVSGSPAPLVDRLRAEAGREVEAPEAGSAQSEVAARAERLVTRAFDDARARRDAWLDLRRRLGRAEVMTMIGERAQELGPQGRGDCRAPGGRGSQGRVRSGEDE